MKPVIRHTFIDEAQQAVFQQFFSCLEEWETRPAKRAKNRREKKGLAHPLPSQKQEETQSSSTLNLPPNKP